MTKSKEHPRAPLGNLFWVTGVIDLAKTCTVKMPKPDISKGEWVGFHYWQEAMNTHGTKLPEQPNQRMRKRCETGKRMLDGDDTTFTYSCEY